eukprot:jgi/Mesvir1/8259/Mv12529-RA.1
MMRGRTLRGRTPTAPSQLGGCPRLAWLALLLAAVLCAAPLVASKGSAKASTQARAEPQDAPKQGTATSSAPEPGLSSVGVLLAGVGLGEGWAAKLASVGVLSRDDLAALSEQELWDSVHGHAGSLGVRGKLLGALWRAKFDTGFRPSLPSLDESLALEGLQHIAAGRHTAALNVLARPVGYVPAVLALHTLLARAPLLAPEADKDSLLALASATMGSLSLDRQLDVASFYSRAITWVEERSPALAGAAATAGQGGREGGVADASGPLQAWLAELWYQRGVFTEHVLPYKSGGGHRGGGDDEALLLRPRNKTTAAMAAVAEGRAPQLRQQGEAGFAHGGVRWLQMAAGAGHAGAMWELARWHQARVWENKTADAARARQLLHHAASLGLPAAKFSVGVELMRGEGVDVCDRKGAAEGSDSTCAWLEGGVTDEAARVAQGARLVREAAEAGLADAQLMVGEWFRDGAKENRGVTDVSEALAWFRRAALQRHADAMYVVSDAAITGTGMPVNMEVAQFWMRQAARKGHGPAMRMVERY